MRKYPMLNPRRVEIFGGWWCIPRPLSTRVSDLEILRRLHLSTTAPFQVVSAAPASVPSRFAASVMKYAYFV